MVGLQRVGATVRSGDATMAGLGKYAEKIRKAEQFVDPLSHVIQLQLASCFFAFHAEADERAEAHAIDKLKIAEVEHDDLTVGKQLRYLLLQETAPASDQVPAALHDAPVV